MEWLDVLLVALAGVAVALGAVRAILGPTMVDRVIALDMLTVSGVAFAALAAHATGARQFLDVGLGIAMLGFIATIAFARMVERMPAGAGGDEGEEKGKGKGEDPAATSPPTSPPTSAAAEGRN